MLADHERLKPIKGHCRDRFILAELPKNAVRASTQPADEYIVRNLGRSYQQFAGITARPADFSRFLKAPLLEMSTAIAVPLLHQSKVCTLLFVGLLLSLHLSALARLALGSRDEGEKVDHASVITRP